MPKISIILPTFNSEKYIKKAIQSVLNQSFNDFELIIVNDGSTDSTLNIIQEFNDSRIKLMSVGVCQKIYRREFLIDIDAKFPEKIFFEDMPFFYYVFLKAERISIIKKHLYYRRKHSQSITHVVDEKFLDTVPAGQILMDIFLENGWYETYKFDLLAYKINGPRFALRDLPEENKKDMFKLIKEDYEEIRRSNYYNDYLDNLGLIKKKFFQDVLKANNYDEFLKLNG